MDYSVALITAIEFLGSYHKRYSGRVRHDSSFFGLFCSPWDSFFRQNQDSAQTL